VETPRALRQVDLDDCSDVGYIDLEGLETDALASA